MLRTAAKPAKRTCLGSPDAWRPHLVGKLQDQYGLPEEEAEKKAEAWLIWLQQQPDRKLQSLPPEEIAAEVHAGTGSKPPASPRRRLGQSRARSAASS